ncbi:hypothetical protein L3Q82_005830 [Scortum barcoo]|uniref:Uncharacterized protein n=1 Tax=Scortum barcoo TaxID=214431 RepID=A0ACB8V748_9TELE|nr:hypothetical protein L3Q82_005830 [Scortum barcoo]
MVVIDNIDNVAVTNALPKNMLSKEHSKYQPGIGRGGEQFRLLSAHSKAASAPKRVQCSPAVPDDSWAALHFQATLQGDATAAGKPEDGLRESSSARPSHAHLSYVCVRGKERGIMMLFCWVYQAMTFGTLWAGLQHSEMRSGPQGQSIHGYQSWETSNFIVIDQSGLSLLFRPPSQKWVFSSLVLVPPHLLLCSSSPHRPVCSVAGSGELQLLSPPPPPFGGKPQQKQLRASRCSFSSAAGRISKKSEQVDFLCVILAKRRSSGSQPEERRRGLLNSKESEARSMLTPQADSNAEVKLSVSVITKFEVEFFFERIFCVCVGVLWVATGEVGSSTVPERTLCKHWRRTEAAAVMLTCFFTVLPVWTECYREKHDIFHFSMCKQVPVENKEMKALSLLFLLLLLLASGACDGVKYISKRNSVTTLVGISQEIDVILGLYVASIHPSIHLHPLGPGPGRGGSSLSRDAQTSLTPDTSSSSSGGTPRRSQAS